MSELTWKGKVLFRDNKVHGWVDSNMGGVWYGRTAGTKELPAIRGEFDNEQSARDFVMFLASTQENPHD
jgi:hypothetical protein